MHQAAHSSASIAIRVVLGIVLIAVHVKSGHYAFAAIGVLSLLSAIYSLVRRRREPQSRSDDRQGQ